MKDETKIVQKKELTEEEMQEYYKEHLLDILKLEDISSDTLKECLQIILDSEILDRSTEDLEYRMNRSQ